MMFSATYGSFTTVNGFTEYICAIACLKV